VSLSSTTALTTTFFPQENPMDTKHTKKGRKKTKTSAIKTFQSAGKINNFKESICTHIYRSECKQKASN